MRTSRSPELWKMVKPMNAINIKGKENVTLSEETRAFIDENLQNLPEDNGLLLRRIRERFDRVGLNLPTVEVRFENLFVGAVCDVVGGKPLLTLTNALKSSISVDGDVSYNGFKLEDFIPQKTSAYVRQHDLHIPELTVRETLDFSARCQGSGSRANLLVELEKSEKEAGIVPDSNLDAYMKAISISGAERTPETDYILKVLGLETCSDVIIGDAMKRGISGGEKKRLTLGHFKERSSTILVFLRPVGAKAIKGTFRASIHVERQQGRKLMQVDILRMPN